MAAVVTDLSEANGWIPEPKDSSVLTKVYQTSAVEAVARRVRMSSRTVSVPRFVSDGADIVLEHGNIPLQDGVADEVVLNAVKFANRFAISIEDDRDSVADAINAKKAAWANSYSKKLDNACLGVTVAKDDTATAPFKSVYFAANAASQMVATAGVLTYEHLAVAFDVIETGDYNGNLVVIAHPAFKNLLRNLKDVAGLRIDPLSNQLAGGVPTLFGHDVVFSNGARTSAVATDAPTGAPLLIIGNRDNLILGVRDGIESAVSNEARWVSDEVELKMRSRRGFVPADGKAFYVISKTVV